VPDDGFGRDAEEVGAMRDAELAFRESHDLLDDQAWSSYVDEVGRKWLASQEPEDEPPLPMPSPPPAPSISGFTPPPSALEDLAASSRPTKFAMRVPTEWRGSHELTPIEAPFYDALAETGLTFSTQTSIRHADKQYRLDFLVWYDGRTVAVELDGHDYHKTREQRTRDAERDRWLGARGIRVVRFTGSEVHANPEKCVRELLDVVRQSQARP
jgi:very-short-patch-repair endonuclease